MPTITETLQRFTQTFRCDIHTDFAQALSKLEQLTDQQHHDCEHLAPAIMSLALLDAVIEQKLHQDMAIVAICLPYAIDTNSTQALQKTLTAENFRLLTQCLRLQALEQLLHTSSSLTGKQHDQLRKMLLAMAGDTRVIVLVLLYQLCYMRQLKQASIASQQQQAELVQSLYAPLANRLGMGQIKWQLEDWAFRYTNLTAYQEIKQALNMRRADRDAYVQQMKSAIEEMVHQSHIKHFQCDGRAKHIYSIYKKCTNKKVGYDALYDTIALRILTDTVDDCYLLLGAIHDRFTPIASEFDDYISNPKPNGYQSIHTVIVGPGNHRVEIQMRTFEMHEQAEHGAYAHWMYKEGGNTEQVQYEQKIMHLRQLLAWQQSVSTETMDTQAATTITDLFADRIYVFSPLGQIIDLPQGATALDFAYTIHTDLGHKTKGAIINGKLTPLHQPLCNGDQVAIQTKKEAAPSRDWLNPQLHYLKTKSAKQKVNHWFKQLNQKENLTKGAAIWDKAWRAKKIDKHSLDSIYTHFNFKDADGLLVALGSGDISVASVMQYLKSLTEDTAPMDASATATIPKIKKHKATSKQASINIAENDGLLYQLAKCCNPIPGDDLLAYNTTTRGLMIHQAQCPNILRAQQQHPDKILAATWSGGTHHHFDTSLLIHIQDRDHLLHDITGLCAQYQISIKAFQVNPRKKGSGPHQLQMSVTVDSPDTLEKFTTALRNMPEVLSISRMG